MSLIPFLGSAVGLFQGLQQNASASAEARRRQQMMEQLYRQNQRLAGQDQAARQERLRQYQASGVGNPDAAISLYQQGAAKQNALNQNNAAALYRVQGYQPGDTPTGNALTMQSEQARFRDAQYVQSLRDRANQQAFSMESMYGSGGVQQANAGLAALYGSMPQQAPVDMSGLVSGLGNMDYDWLKPRKKVVRPVAVQPDPSLVLTAEEFQEMRRLYGSR